MMTNVGAKATALETANYGCIFVCREIDRFEHSAVFANEIIAGFSQLGVVIKSIDYREQPRAALEMLHDSNCKFAISLNGFGSELLVATGHGKNRSAFDLFQKPLYDFMHDMPSAESMAHQTESRSPWRNLLLTDWGYVAEANELGIQNVRYTTSITFPQTLPAAGPLLDTRKISLLLPIGLTPPSSVRSRFEQVDSLLQRLYRAVFEHVVQLCVSDRSLDPRVEVRRACRESGLHFDANHPNSRFLLTSTTDCVKFERRDRLIRNMSANVTVVADRPIDAEEYGTKISVVPARNFSDLLKLMTESQIVLCPLPHKTGFHERALGSFSATSVVLSSPNDVLETNFRYGEEFLVYRSEEECDNIVSQALLDIPNLQKIANGGHERACRLFYPVEFARRILSMERLRAT